MKRTVRQERTANGLCPRCGEEAAPYLLCPRHRLEARVVRVLNRAAAAGGVVKIKQGGRTLWKAHQDRAAGRAILDAMDWRSFDPDTDRRFQPRLGRVPVDVMDTLLTLMGDIGPATIEEIVAAWGRLREKRKHGSLQADMRALIEAKRKRDAKRAKRVAAEARA